MIHLYFFGYYLTTLLELGFIVIFRLPGYFIVKVWIWDTYLKRTPIFVYQFNFYEMILIEKTKLTSLYINNFVSTNDEIRPRHKSVVPSPFSPVP